MRNLKRALSLGLTAAMISGLMVMGSSAAGYADVTSEQNQEAIEVLQAVGIMVGDDNGNFNPDQQVTRNEMAVVMSNLMEYNVASYANTSPFTDVPEWAEPYVAACWTNGITAGYSDTIYGGSDSVTTAQAALMLMKALGYFQYQQDFGSDWQLATITKGNDISLFEDVDSGVREAMTRNDLAQLVLNTLKAGTVRASTSGSITVGGVTIATSVEYNFITSERSYASAIGRVKDTTSSSDASAYVVELGESLYQGELKKTESQDDFGRPANIWEYESKEIGTYADVAAATWTTRVNERDLYSAAGSAAVNEYTWTVYEDGVEIDTFKYEDDNDLMPSRSSSDRWNGTGNGILTEVFVDSQEDQVIVTKINTYLAEVTKVEENEDDYTVTVSYKTSPSGSVSREFDTTTEFAREDIVLVTLAGESGNTKEIQSLTLAETVNGTVSAVRDSDYLRMDGTTYNYNYGYTSNDRILGALYDLDDNTAGGKDPKAGDECTIYLDLYGNAIAVENADVTADDYLYVSAVESSYGDVSAKVVFSDGREEIIDIDELDNLDAVKSGAGSGEKVLAPDAVYRFSQSGSKYDLFSQGNNSAIDDDFYAYKLDDNTYTGKIENDSAAFRAKYQDRSNSNTTNPSAVTYTATSNTVFVDADKNAAYIGYAEVPSMSGVEGWVITESSTEGAGRAVIVFVTNDVDYDMDDDSFFFVKDLKAETEDTDNNTLYRWDIVTTGEDDQLVASSNLSSVINEKGVYQIKSYDSDDYVTKVESIVDIPDNFDPATASAYATDTDGNVLDVTAASNKLTGDGAGKTSFSYNSETSFMIVEMDKQKGEVGDVYITNSTSMIETNETGSSADNSDRTAVYIINADDTDKTVPLATLVLVVVPDTREETTPTPPTSGVQMNFNQTARVTIGETTYTSTGEYDLPVDEQVTVTVSFGTTAKNNDLDVVKYNGTVLADEFGDGSYLITFSAGDTLEIGLESSNLTLPTNVTASWTADSSKGITAGNASASASTVVPVGAQVTMEVATSTPYYVNYGTEYKTADESFTAFAMTATDVEVSADRYNKVTINIDSTTDSNVATNLGGVTVDTSFADDTYVKQGEATDVVFTLGNSGAVVTNPIKIQLTSATGVTSSKYSSAQDLLAVGDTQETDISAKADQITIDDTAATADLTITYKLTTSI